MSCTSGCTSECNNTHSIELVSPSVDFCIPAWGNAEIILDMNSDTSVNKPVNIFDYQLFRMTINNLNQNQKVKFTSQHQLLDSPTNSILLLQDIGQYTLIGTVFSNIVYWRINKHKSPAYNFSN